MTRKWHDTQSVVPAKAGTQSTLLWIPLPRKGQKDDRGEGMSHNFADVKLRTRQYTRVEFHPRLKTTGL